MSKIVRLNTPPIPTLSDPLAQVNWIFFVAESQAGNKNADGFRNARSKYLKFLSDTSAYYPELEQNSRFYLDKFWEFDALIRFNKWLNNEAITSKTRYSIYKRVRQVMDLAYGLRVTHRIVYHAPMFKGVRETKERAAYSGREQEVINASIARWISLGVSVVKGYIPTNAGIPFNRLNQVNALVIDGREITTIEASKEYGLPRGKIQKRLRLGWTSREAVGLDARKHQSSYGISIVGKTFESITEAARHYCINEYTFRRRLKSGYTPEQAAGIEPAPPKKQKGILFNRKFYSTIKALADEYHIPHKKLTRRLQANWPIDQALEINSRFIKDGQSTPVTIEGVTYSSLGLASKAYGVEAHTISDKLKFGASPEQAVGLVPQYVSRFDERAHLWLFEEVYECDASKMMNDLYKRKLFQNYGLNKSKLLKLFAKWGVWPYIDAMIIMPMAVELAMLTGLNVEAIKALNLNSYTDSHHLTGQPAIAYTKYRSGTSLTPDEHDLHLPLLEVEELHLEDSVAKKVQTLISLIKTLTAKIRNNAPKEIANTLFIFEDVELTFKSGCVTIVAIDPKKKACSWRTIFSREEGFRQIFGENFNFNISRCRPTLATNMVLAGADLHQVQVVLGHQHLQTTANYLDGLQLQPMFNKTLSEALTAISNRSFDHLTKEHKKSPTVEAEVKPILFETLSGCGCKDAYNPSENVRKATNFSEGSVCKYWNMCLLCDNAIITPQSLPKLIKYKARIEKSLESSGRVIQSRQQLFKDALILISGILEPDNIFPKNIIDEAKVIAKSEDDLLIDQLIYQGV